MAANGPFVNAAMHAELHTADPQLRAQQEEQQRQDQERLQREAEDAARKPLPASSATQHYLDDSGDVDMDGQSGRREGGVNEHGRATSEPPAAQPPPAFKLAASYFKVEPDPVKDALRMNYPDTAECTLRVSNLCPSTEPHPNEACPLQGWRKSKVRRSRSPELGVQGGVRKHDGGGRRGGRGGRGGGGRGSGVSLIALGKAAGVSAGETIRTVIRPGRKGGQGESA